VSDVSKKARRDQAREHAREMREKERKRKQRNGWIIKGSVGLALVAIAVVTVLIFNNVRQAQVEAATPKPGPANMISDGILLTGDGTGEIVAVPTGAIAPKGQPTPTDLTKYPDTVNIVTYVDYFCPVCQAFEQTNLEQIGTWVSSGVATLEVHPIAILDGASMGTRYASRAANAMACVAEFQPNSYFAASGAMYQSQPAEGTTGLKNEEIIQVLAAAGVTEPKVADCINKESFKQWVTAATERTRGPVPNSELAAVAGTPTVLVNGVQYTGAPNDKQAFLDFVSAVAMSTMAQPTPEPTP
jgi:protein-disulfide isomerase